MMYNMCYYTTRSTVHVLVNCTPGLFIHRIKWKHWIALLKIITRTSRWWTAECKILNNYLRYFDILSSFCWTSCQKSSYDQQFLDYIWYISRDWERDKRERVQGSTILYGRLKTPDIQLSETKYSSPQLHYKTTSFNTSQTSEIKFIHH